MRAKTSKTAIDMKQRQIQALNLRIAGASIRQIAEHMKCSVATAHKLVSREIRELDDKIEELQNQYKRLNLSRTDALISAHWNSRGNPRNAEIILKSAAEQNRIIGAYAPIKTEGINANVNINQNLTPEEIETEIDRMIRDRIEVEKTHDDDGND